MIKDACGTVHPPCVRAPRIASLVPSLTELVCDLGLGEFLVARTGFCVHPRQRLRAVPKVGGTKDVDLAALRARAPTHVIVNVDENRREHVDAIREFVPHVIVTHPLCPEDNLLLYELFGSVFDRRREAAALAQDLAAALRRLHGAARAWPRERVLYLIWRQPWMSIARDTYISATLAAAGWDTVPEVSALRYPEIDAADPLWHQVGRILLPGEPYRFLRRHEEEIRLLRPDAAITRIDGEMTSWYGSRAPRGLRYLASLRSEMLAGG